MIAKLKFKVNFYQNFCICPKNFVTLRPKLVYCVLLV